MKTILLLSMEICLLGAGLAVGQQWKQRTTLYVPFDFVVGEAVLPEGTYSVSTSITDHLLMLKNTETGDAALTNCKDILTKPHRTLDSSSLVFVEDTSGAKILGQMWVQGDEHGHDLTHGQGVPEPR